MRNRQLSSARLRTLLAAMAVLVGMGVTGLGFSAPAVADTTATISGLVGLGRPVVLAPAGSAEVQYQMQVGNAWSTVLGTVPVGNGGAYSIPGLANGTYLLRVVYLGADGYQSVYYGSSPSILHARTITLTGTNVTANVYLPAPSSVSGTVYLDGTDHPAGAGDAVVSITVFNSDTSAQDVVATTSTDASGYYQFPTLPGIGNYLITATPAHDPSYATGQASVDSVSGSSFPGTDITLIRYYTVSGHLTLGTSARDAVAGEIGVSLYQWDATAWSYVEGTASDAYGNYALTGVRSGRYQVVLSYSGTEDFATYTVPSPPSSSCAASCTFNTSDTSNAAITLNANLPRGNDLSGTVTTSSGAPIANAQVHIEDHDPVTDADVGDYGTTTLADGSWHLGSLPAGNYRVQFWAPPYAPRWWNGRSDYYTGDDIALSGGITVPQISTQLYQESLVDVFLTFPGGIQTEVNAGDATYQLQYLNTNTGYWTATGTPRIVAPMPAPLYALTPVGGQISVPLDPTVSYRVQVDYRGSTGHGDWVSAPIPLTQGATTHLSATVNVVPNAAGSFDTASGVFGGISISGWSLDLSTTASTYVWVNVDGSGGPMLANASLPWINSLFPAEGANHGFAGTVAASPGNHTVCVYGSNSTLLGCRVVTVPQNAQGSFDSASGVVGGIQISGWSLDQSTAASTYVWVNVDGAGGPMMANVSLPWINGLFPGEGANHGFAATLSAPPGRHTVCVYGTNSLSLGCKVVTVPQNAQGSFDTVAGVPGAIQISGWSLDLSTVASTYVWVNIDGTGGPLLANASLPWINALFTGEGANHGFAGTLTASPGEHTVCVYGTNSLALGCKVVTVPQNAAGSFDTAIGVTGGIQISGWSLDLSTAASTYIWVNVDGSGGPMIANVSLPWVNALFPGEGTNHGFAGTAAASAGKHTVCVYGTNSLPLGCKAVTVPVG